MEVFATNKAKHAAMLNRLRLNFIVATSFILYLKYNILALYLKPIMHKW